MSQVKAYSTLTGDVIDIGPPTEDVDAILGLADTMATNRDGLIVYLEGPVLQKWGQET